MSDSQSWTDLEIRAWLDATEREITLVSSKEVFPAAKSCNGSSKKRRRSSDFSMAPPQTKRPHLLGSDPDLSPRTSSFDLRSTTTRSSDRRSGSSRSSSPTKRKADLSLCEPSIRFVEGADRQDADRKFLEEIRDAGEVLLLQLKDRFEAHPVVGGSLRRVLWTAKAEDSMVSSLWERARRIEDNARLCSSEDRFEDSWSDLVVLKVLELAIDLAGLENKVMLLPLRSVGVDPKGLLPQHVPGGSALDKKIDYGFGIELGTEEMQKVKKSWDRRLQPAIQAATVSGSSKPQPAPLPSIGPSTRPLLRSRPLFCNFELKKDASSDDPRFQLGVWTSAIFSRWEQLGGDTAAMPPTLCWTVRGHIWQLHLARRKLDGDREISASIESYHTDNLIHIFYILFTLSYILKWGDNEFRNGFMNFLPDEDESP